MNISRSPHCLFVLLLASVALNAWQFFRVRLEPDEGTRKPVAAAISESFTTGMGPQPEKQPASKSDAKGDTEPPDKPIASKPSPEQQTEDELIFGADSYASLPLSDGRSEGQISTQRLKELAATPASQAVRFQVHTRLLLPGDRALDLGTSEIAPGQALKLDRIREFPFPTSFAFPRFEERQAGNPISPVTPTTPGSFEFRNRGLEIEIDVTPAAGALVIGGNVTQRVFEGFSRMPGQAFSPITDGNDTVLTDNKVLQPQFTTRESPFVAAATAGQPCRVPVQMSFGQTFLELTCTPLE